MSGSGLSQRQIYVLGEMGVDVWQLRGRSSGAVAESTADVDPAPEQVAPLAQPALARSPEPATVPVNSPAAAVNDADWAPLNAAIRSCTNCGLHTTRTNAVCGVGNRTADWLIVGEAPGGDEDRKGEPFVGRAGQLLNEMLRAIGLQREQVFIANILKCRPPNNRDPQAAEIEQCLPYLQRQIELLQPRVILVVGRIAAQTLLDTQLTVGRLRGRPHEYRGVPLIVTYHPAYLLRRPTEKSKSWSDLLLATEVAQGRAAQGVSA